MILSWNERGVWMENYGSTLIPFRVLSSVWYLQGSVTNIESVLTNPVINYEIPPLSLCRVSRCGVRSSNRASDESSFLKTFKVSAFLSSEHALRQQRTNQYLLIQSIKQGRKQEEGGRVYCLLIRDMTRLRSSFLDTGYRIFLHFVTC